MNSTENMNTTTASLFRQALISPEEVSMADFDRLLSAYPYAQPLHFALARKIFLAGDEHFLSKKAILLAPSADWLREYVQGREAEVPFAPETESEDPEPAPTAPDDREDPWPEIAQNEAVADKSEAIVDAATNEMAESGVEMAESGELRLEIVQNGDIDVVVETEATSEPIAAAADETPESVADTADREDIPLEIVQNELVDDTIEAEAKTESAEEVTEKEETEPVETEIPEEIAEEEVISAEVTDNEPADSRGDELESLMMGNIGGGDYFSSFYKDSAEDGPDPIATAKAERNPAKEEEPAAASPQEDPMEDVSLYDDELMPYTFRWWLHKTRSEHARSVRPFAPDVPPPSAKTRIDQAKLDDIILEQQIRAHILHLQSPEDKLSEEVRKKKVPPATPNKTTEAIERFIREKPQIQPPPAGLLTVENKASKSSEEHFDLVTETLAAIYTHQGMPAKAIEVYKKLILKFPEKKPYFAAHIEKLKEILD